MNEAQVWVVVCDTVKERTLTLTMSEAMSARALYRSFGLVAIITYYRSAPIGYAIVGK
jgi:hypothetical protein